MLAQAGTTLGTEHFSETLGAEFEGLPPPPSAHADEPLRETLARIEAALLHRALQRNGNRRSETARRLGITREGFYK